MKKHKFANNLTAAGATGKISPDLESFKTALVKVALKRLELTKVVFTREKGLGKNCKS